MTSGKADSTPQVSTLTKAKAIDNMWKIKEVAGILLGILLGALPLRSYFGFPLYIAAQFWAVKLYAFLFRVPKHILNNKEMILEFTINSAGSFLLSWIVSYSLFQY